MKRVREPVLVQQRALDIPVNTPIDYRVTWVRVPRQILGNILRPHEYDVAFCAFLGGVGHTARDGHLEQIACHGSWNNASNITFL